MKYIILSNIQKKGFILILLFLTALYICFGTESHSLAEVKTSQVFDLGEVVVTAEGEMKESPATIEVVTAEDIKRKNATNIGEALEFLPGLQFRQARSKNEFYLTVRGFEQEKVLILLDGVPIYVPYEGLVNLTDIPVQNIAEIKVIKGNASTLYGSNSMGGVVNIITKKGTEQPSLSASYQVSDYNTHHLEISHGWKIKKFSYFITASHRESDGYNLSETFRLPKDVLDSMTSAPTNPSNLKNTPIAPDSGKRDNSDYERDAITFTGSIEINPYHKLGLSFEYYENEYGIPPVPIYRETKKGFFYFPRYWRFTDWQRYTVNLIEDSKFSETFRTKFRIFYDDYYNVLNAYDDDTYSTQDRVGGPPSGESVFDDYSVGGNLYAFWNGIPKNEIRFGFGFKQDVHRETFQDSPEDRLISDTYSVALEDQIKITDNLSTTLGISYDIFDKRKRIRESALDGDPGDDVYVLSPQIGFHYDYSPKVSFYGSIGQKVRFPTMRNLYATGVIGPEGNPDLKEEKAYNYEIGGRWLMHERFTTDWALFYSDVRNMINFDNQIGRFEQYDRATLAGIELSFLSQITDNLFARLSYTYLYAKNHSNVTIENDFHEPLKYKPDDLPYRPEHKVDLELIQKFNFGMEVNLNGSYISERTYYDHADTTNNTILVADKKHLDSYFLVNMKVSQKFWRNSQIYIAIDNLFNETYQDLYQFATPGITFWGGLKIEI